MSQELAMEFFPFAKDGIFKSKMKLNVALRIVNVIELSTMTAQSIVKYDDKAKYLLYYFERNERDVEIFR